MLHHDAPLFVVASALSDRHGFHGWSYSPASTADVPRSPVHEKWREAVLSELSSFVDLSPDWDGYGAPRVSRTVAALALRILDGVMEPRMPAPQVVPSSSGGVQIEWHVRDIDLELHVAGFYEFELWFEDLRGEHPSRSEDLSTSLAAFRDAVAVLASRC